MNQPIDRDPRCVMNPTRSCLAKCDLRDEMKRMTRGFSQPTYDRFKELEQRANSGDPDAQRERDFYDANAPLVPPWDRARCRRNNLPGQN